MTAELKTQHRGDFSNSEEKHEIMQPNTTLEHSTKVFKLLFSKAQSGMLLQTIVQVPRTSDPAAQTPPSPKKMPRRPTSLRLM